MSAVQAFDELSFSPWYLEIMKRTLFELKTPQELGEWEERVTELFLEQETACLIALNYLKSLGIEVQGLETRRMALAISNKLYSEFLHRGEQRADTQTQSLLVHIELGLITRESPVSLGEENHMDDSEVPPERPEHWDFQLSDWASKLRTFFFIDPCKKTEAAAVEALRQMRQAGKKRDRPTSKHSHLSSVLAKLILSITDPSMLLASKSEFMQGSFRKYQWREALLLCLASLTSDFELKDLDLIRQEMKDAPTSPKASSRFSVSEFLRLISTEALIPIAVKPHTIFFLSSKQNFIAAYWDWLHHSVSRAGMKFDLQDADIAYQGICRMTEAGWVKLKLSPEVNDILSLSQNLRKNRKKWKVTAHQSKNRDRVPSGHCRICAHLEDAKKCVQYIRIEDVGLEKVNRKWIVPGDVHALSRELKDKCIALSELNFGLIEFREEIYSRCGRFVIHLVRSDTGEEVAGVIFRLLNSESTSKLAENQDKIKRLTAKLRRGKLFSEFSNVFPGGMHPVGFRQAAGGRPGDGYGPYPASEVLDLEDIRTLFSYATDIECILAHVHPHASSVVADLNALGEEACVLGHYGVTAFHCWNYIAPQHCDNDDSWTISYQLFKEGCKEDEFNFSFSRWGKVLKTIPNCVWWFRGQDMHGTVIARPSTLSRGGVLSQGVGITMPHRTLQAAKRYLQARWSWKDLCELWGADPS